MITYDTPQIIDISYVLSFDTSDVPELQHILLKKNFRHLCASTLSSLGYRQILDELCTYFLQALLPCSQLINL